MQWSLMAALSVPSWAVAATAVTQSSAITVGNCGTPIRRATRRGASGRATRRAATIPPRCMSSMKNPVEVCVSLFVAEWRCFFFFSGLLNKHVVIDHTLILLLKMQRRSNRALAAAPTSWRPTTAAVTAWTAPCVPVSSAGCACRRSLMCTTSGMAGSHVAARSSYCSAKLTKGRASQSLRMYILGKEAMVPNPQGSVAGGHVARSTGGHLPHSRPCHPGNHCGDTNLHGPQGSRQPELHAVMLLAGCL